jgi:hypothetical protein
MLAFAMVHLVDRDLPQLQDALAMTRRELRVTEHFAFHHVGASVAVHERLYAALRAVPFAARVLLVDKELWTPDYISRSSGPDRISDGLIRLVLACPDDVIARQRLLIDLEPRDRRIVRELAAAVRRSLQGVGRESFARVQACPDTRGGYGELIQIADMIAGEVREQGGIGGRYLSTLGGRIQLED